MSASTERTEAAPAPREGRRCPRCRALNPASAPWCGQCLEPLGSEGAGETNTEPAAGVPQGAAAPSRSESSRAGGSGVFGVGPEGITWTCRVCDSVNPFELRTCSVCGATLAATLREPEQERPERDPGKTALMSLFLPGAGHAYLGLWGQAVARAVTSLWVLFVLLATALEQGLAAPTPVIFGIASFGLWAVAAHDAYREAQHQPGAVLLKGRAFFYAVLGLIGLSIVMVLVTAMSVRSA